MILVKYGLWKPEDLQSLNFRLPSLPSLSLSSPPLPSSPSPLWVSSWWCVRGWGDDEECCCCDLEGFRVAQTVAHTQVCIHTQACATQTDVWQIALSRLSKSPWYLCCYQFLSCRSLRNVLLATWILWLIMSEMTLLTPCKVVHVCVNSGANCCGFMCVSCDLGSALQTGLRAWLNLCWQVKPLLHEGFSVCSYCVMTTFQPLWATVWH